MRTQPPPSKLLLATAAILLIHPLLLAQEAASSVGLPDPPPLQIGSLIPDSRSPENWSSSRASADPVPPAPVIAINPAQFSKSESHHFGDRENRILFIAAGSMATADFMVTHSNLSNGGRELNPITRVFSGSTAGLATNFALETGGVIGISYLFHKSGHHKLERLTSYVDIGASAGAVAYGLTHR